MATPTATLPASVQPARTDRVALAMFAVLLLSYVINAMDRQLFSVLAPDVR